MNAVPESKNTGTMRIATTGVHRSTQRNLSNTNLRNSFLVNFLSRTSVQTIALERQYAMRRTIAIDTVASANDDRKMFIDAVRDSTVAVPAAWSSSIGVLVA